VITDTETKMKIQGVAWGQTQVGAASHLLFFVAITDSELVAERYISANKLDEYNPDYANMIRSIKARPDFEAWAAKQAYIALGVALSVCAEQKYVCFPIVL
jgi:hypothetical protein